MFSYSARKWANGRNCESRTFGNLRKKKILLTHLLHCQKLLEIGGLCTKLTVYVFFLGYLFSCFGDDGVWKFRGTSCKNGGRDFFVRAVGSGA